MRKLIVVALAGMIFSKIRFGSFVPPEVKIIPRNPGNYGLLGGVEHFLIPSAANRARQIVIIHEGETAVLRSVHGRSTDAHR